MKREYEIHPDLDKILSKLSKKDKVQFEVLLKKIDQIIESPDPDHYKNLRSTLQRYKRVHIYSSFILIFRIEQNKIVFRYYGHHDGIYKRQF